MTPDMPVLRLPHAEGLPLPAYETPGSAGLDLRAAVPEGDPMTLPPGGRAAVPTGLAFAIPLGFEGQIRSRSGLAVKAGITCLTGTIDSDYRGEVAVLLVNLGQEPWTLEPGERIAQLVVARYTRVELVETDTLDDTDRGAGGFGSTGR